LFNHYINDTLLHKFIAKMLKNLLNLTNDAIPKRFICFKGTVKTISHIENIHSIYRRFTCYWHIIDHICPVDPFRQNKRTHSSELGAIHEFSNFTKKNFELIPISKNLNLKVGGWVNVYLITQSLKINNKKSLVDSE